MWILAALLIAVSAMEEPLNPLRAKACIELSNEFVVKDPEVAKTISTSAYPHHETMKHISIDMLIYCYNHMTPDLAKKVLKKEISYKDKEAAEVCKYRRSQFTKKDGDITVSDERLNTSKRILEASQHAHEKTTKNEL